MDVLRRKPTSVVTIKTPATYEDIMKAVATGELSNKTLRAVVNMCRTNPEKVCFIVYRSFENSILMIFGEKPVCLRVEGSRLESIVSHHSKEDNVYVFTYVK